MYSQDYQLNIINDAASLVMGLYKGAMDAKGITQDTDSLIYTGLATSLLRGVVGIRAAKIHNRDPYFNIDSLNVGKKISPITEGIKQSSVGAVISALEITVGYAVGWSLAKII